MNDLERRSLLLSLLVAATACGGSSPTSPAAGAAAEAADSSVPPVTADAPDDSDAGDAIDSATSSPSDAGASDAAPPAAPYPAPHPVQPQVVTLGGKVLAKPVIVPVTFPNDPLSPDIDTFVAAFSKTTYWGSVTAEYGVAPAVPGTPVHVAEAAAATIDDTAIQTWLAGRLDGTHPEWPAPTDGTLYVLYYPPGTTVTYPDLGDSCTAFHGYHSNAPLANGTQVPYAVVSRCAGIPEAPVTGIQYVSAVASHEIIEGMTDPFPMTTPAFVQTDDDHMAWMYVTGGEVGDMCALNGSSFYMPSDFPYTVQRIWSNAVALTGHDPCVPQPMGTPYIQSVPVVTDTLTIPADQGGGMTKGLQIPIGASKTIEVDLFSDQETKGPWTVKAIEPRPAATPTLSFTWDKTTGTNPVYEGEPTASAASVTLWCPRRRSSAARATRRLRRY